MKNILPLLFLVVSASFSSAQNVGIGADSFTPDASAILELRSTTSGVLMPRMTESERDLISSPAMGLMIYQKDNSPGYYYYNGVTWVPFGGSDDFGDHVAEENISLDGNWLSNDGDDEGVYISSNGNVGIGVATPLAAFHTAGTVRHEALAGVGNRMVVADANGNLSTQSLPMPTTVVSSSNQNINSSSYNSVSGMSVSGVSAGSYLVNFNADISRNGSSSCQCIVRAGGSDVSASERTFQIPSSGDSQFHLMGKVTLASSGTIEIRCKKIPGGSGLTVKNRSMSIQPTN